MKLSSINLHRIDQEIATIRFSVDGALAEMCTLLDPGAADFMTPVPAAKAAARAGVIMHGLASLYVALQWREGISKAISVYGDKAEGSHVEAAMVDLLLKRTADCSRAQGNTGVIENAWRTTLTEATSAAIKIIQMEIQTEQTIREMCTRVGCSFESFQAGDPDTIQRVTEASLDFAVAQGSMSSDEAAKIGARLRERTDVAKADVAESAAIGKAEGELVPEGVNDDVIDGPRSADGVHRTPPRPQFAFGRRVPRDEAPPTGDYLGYIGPNHDRPAIND